MTLQRKHLVAIAIATGFALLVFLGDLLIVTEAERIDATMDGIRSAVEKSDASALMERISEDFYDRRELGREQLAAVAENAFRAYGPVEFVRFRYEKNRVGNTAAIVLNVIASTEEGGGTNISVWELELKKESDGAWRVTDLSPVRMNGRNVDGWRDISSFRSF